LKKDIRINEGTRQNNSMREGTRRKEGCKEKEPEAVSLDEVLGENIVLS
jgi:hypothetical protein